MRTLPTTLLWLSLVFASGLTMGVVGHRFFQSKPEPPPREERPSRAQMRQDYLEKLRSRVGVDEAQVQQIVVVLDKARANADAHKANMEAEMRQMQEATRAEIRAILRPDQLARYEQWREERRREREKWERERGGAPGEANRGGR
ncbi:MAG: hypothetical protein MUF01_08960 [Bryobacterales bacterium]|jgi:hypothetical protein|nr:hypothetical protein [Bryobacterales bacterium]